jgi:RNA polymerase sigma factor (sigma-70 family)
MRAPVASPASTPARGRTATLGLDDLFLFVTAASAAALHASSLDAATAERSAAVAPPAAVATAPAPLRAVAAPGAQARYATLLTSYDRLIRGIVARVGRRLGLNRDNFLAREDIAQEVRLDLWKQIARGQTIDFPATYIYKATLRETLRALRRQAARETVSVQDSGAEELQDPADPFHALAAKEQFREIILAIRLLTPERQRAVRAHLTGFAFHEIMRLYGWTYQKTRNLISRGMGELRKSLNDKGEAPEAVHELLPNRHPATPVASPRRAAALVREARLAAVVRRSRG